MKSFGVEDWGRSGLFEPEETDPILSTRISAPVRFYGPAHPSGRATLKVRDWTSWAILDQSDFINQVNTITVDTAKQSHLLEEQFRAAFGYTQRVSELCQRLEGIEAALVAVVRKLDHVATEPHFSLWVPLESLTAQYKVLRPMTSVVVPCDDGFEAALYDVNLYSTGETQEEAVSSLKSLLLDVFDHLTVQDDDLLGPEPLRQKKFLTEHIAKV